MSDNSEILIIWHLRRAVPRAEVFAFYQEKSFSSETDLRDFFFYTTNILCS
jgi:hypothetical protein